MKKSKKTRKIGKEDEEERKGEERRGKERSDSCQADDSKMRVIPNWAKRSIDKIRPLMYR